MNTTALYERLGGYDAIAALVEVQAAHSKQF
jgi:hypothetical protein